MKIPPALADLPQPLYFFDGQCVLCSRFVAFCLKRDPAGRLKFASAQSLLGKRVLAALDLPGDTLDRTILLLENGKVYTRSTAALRALRHLKGPARGLYPLILLPKILRDPIYDIVARNRIRWFGRLDSCLVPSPQTRDRFIDL
ncbi:thiol-disulfide oxidoreductase DCC family protein [Reyranella sp.]|uniref:thiol-disulfide oxidoreductase DCC family protein n=1 Tax=Reyranella sp. TaxID=1929291 RepID=UPI003C7A8C10